MRIVAARPVDLSGVLSVERAAFGRDDEAELVRNLLNDPSSLPLVSLLALEERQPVGHVLFTTAHLEGAHTVPIAVLAPLAVVPEAQGKGIGGRLIERGVQILAERDVELVFVTGHPSYYPRHGFEPAGHHGFAPPFSIPPEDEDAWMVRALRPGVLGSVRGRVICADALDKPEYWRE